MFKLPYSMDMSRTVLEARTQAVLMGQTEIEPNHLFMAVLEDVYSVGRVILESNNIDISMMYELIREKICVPGEKRSEVAAIGEDELALSDDSVNVLNRSVREASSLSSKTINTGHLILSLLKHIECEATTVLKQFGFDANTFRDALILHKNIIPQDSFDLENDDDDDNDEDASFDNGGYTSEVLKKNTEKSNSTTPFVDKYSVDITKAAVQGTLDPVIGRETEIERIAQILSRRKKNNPIIIGEAGVGKSAIVEGLAMRIAQKKVGRQLYNKRVVSLDLSLVVAGAKYRGQFEERIKKILQELKDNKDVIVFIDEIHTIIGSGSSPGSMDAANMLKPALARGEIQCIGATTTDEYRKTIEKDSALERRFQKIMVKPTTKEETLQILNNIKDKYEAYHNVRYTEEAIQACVVLSDRYITDRSFPDKAIDVLDEAGSRSHMKNIEEPSQIKELEKLAVSYKESKLKAVEEQSFEEAASIRDKEISVCESIEKLRKEWLASIVDVEEIVDKENIENVVSMMTGIPVQKMAKEETNRLGGMKAELSSRVIAQDEAIYKLVRAITRSRIGLKDPNRPIGTFMFLGPTGVGKTHLAKRLSDFMFGTPDALIRIDMSEYMEKHTVSRLIGAPPGYVGYDQGGELTEKVRRRPYSIILLDEIEKANSEVFNILLQIMDDGRLTDGNGVTIDFKNTIIILTSNIGTRQLGDLNKTVGFTKPSEAKDLQKLSDGIVQKALEKKFAPEFLNRLDEIITFNQLDKDAIKTIAEIEIKALRDRLENIGFSITIDKEAMDFVVDKGYDKQYGARPLKRAVQKYLEDGLCELIMSGLEAGSVIKITKKQDKDELNFE